MSVRRGRGPLHEGAQPRGQPFAALPQLGGYRTIVRRDFAIAPGDLVVKRGDREILGSDAVDGDDAAVVAGGGKLPGEHGIVGHRVRRRAPGLAI